jgi:Trypsin
MKILIAMAVIALGLSHASTAWSQPGSTPQPASGSTATLQLSAPTAAFQTQALGQLQQQARTLAGGDEAKFTALLRQGLARLPRELDKSDRAIGSGSTAVVTQSLDPNVLPSSADADPRLQSVVLRTVTESRKFGIRMVGSTDAPPGSHPETVALVQDDRQSLCTGVMVAPGAILTAAHCVCELGLQNSPNQVAFGTDVKLPETVAYTIPEQTRIFPSLAATPPSTYCANYKRFAVGGRGRVCDRDVALVQFDPARTPTGVMMPKFASKSDLDTAYERVNFADRGTLLPMEVVGYGVTRIVEGSGIYQYGSDGRKRYGRFTFYFNCPGDPPYDCAVANGAYCMGSTEIVIEDIKYKTTDSCAGDSGGPAFIMTSGGEWRLAGLVSRAVRSDGDCGPGGVYSAVFLGDVVTWLGHLNITVAQ